MPKKPAIAYQISIGGKSFPGPTRSDIKVLSVEVSEDLEAPAMFAIELASAGLVKKGDIAWIDESLFDSGSEVEIQMGVGTDLKPLIAGEITGLEPEFGNDTATLVVRGHDRLHRLLRGRKTASYVGMKDSDIAKKIAGRSKLSPKVEDTKVKLDYVLQHNQTDMEFLSDRAERIGYEFFVDNKTLYFRKPQNTTQKVLTLEREEDLISFSPRLSTMNQVDRVEVRYWDPKKKKMFVGKADASKIKAMGGSTSGPKAVQKEFGTATLSIVDRPVQSQEEAEKIAQGLLDDLAIAYITGEGICNGRPDLRAGKTIEITGLGQRFSGPYYITSTIHSYNPEEGYTTSFTVRRNST